MPVAREEHRAAGDATLAHHLPCVEVGKARTVEPVCEAAVDAAVAFDQILLARHDHRQDAEPAPASALGEIGKLDDDLAAHPVAERWLRVERNASERVGPGEGAERVLDALQLADRPRQAG